MSLTASPSFPLRWTVPPWCPAWPTFIPTPLNVSYDSDVPRTDVSYGPDVPRTDVSYDSDVPRTDVSLPHDLRSRPSHVLGEASTDVPTPLSVAAVQIRDMEVTIWLRARGCM